MIVLVKRFMMIVTFVQVVTVVILLIAILIVKETVLVQLLWMTVVSVLKARLV